MVEYGDMNICVVWLENIYAVTDIIQKCVCWEVIDIIEIFLHQRSIISRSKIIFASFSAPIAHLMKNLSVQQWSRSRNFPVYYQAVIFISVQGASGDSEF